MVKARALFNQGDREGASAILLKILADDFKNADAFELLGIIALQNSEFELALECFNFAINIDQTFVAAYANRAATQIAMGCYEDANESIDRVFALRKPGPKDWFNRGLVLQYQKRYSEAVLAYEQALAGDSRLINALQNLGNCYCEIGSWQKAVEIFNQMIEKDSSKADAFISRGVAYQSMGQLEEAKRDYIAVLRQSPHNAKAELNLAIAELMGGEYLEGWQRYEARWRQSEEVIEHRNFTAPKLASKEVAGKTILLHAEQALGDCIQFSRYATVLGRMGARVLLEAPSTLCELLTSLHHVAEVIPRNDHKSGDLAHANPNVDYHIPLMSMPGVMGTTLESVPWDGPYLKASSTFTQAWAERLGPRTKPRIGLVWSGGLRDDQPHLWASNRRRNLPLHLLQPLSRHPFEWVSIQLGTEALEEWALLREQQKAQLTLLDFTEHLTDFSQTAALIEQIDLVITVDTSVAHLAAAMGKPTWILNRYDSCWRWMLSRSDSPWYPTVRIFRQPKPGDWQAVVQAVNEALIEFEQ
jgi:pentatricopeptide repeat protein